MINEHWSSMLVRFKLTFQFNKALSVMEQKRECNEIQKTRAIPIDSARRSLELLRYYLLSKWSYYYNDHNHTVLALTCTLWTVGIIVSRVYLHVFDIQSRVPPSL